MSLDVSTQTVFLYCMLVKYTLKDYFLYFSCPCCALVMMPNRRNQCNSASLHRLYTWEKKRIVVILLITVDLSKHSNNSVSVSMCILNQTFILSSVLDLA